MKYKLVKFADGRYAARRGWFVYEYLEVGGSLGNSWTKPEFVECYCKGTRAEAQQALDVYYRVQDRGTPV